VILYASTITCSEVGTTASVRYTGQRDVEINDMESWIQLQSHCNVGQGLKGGTKVQTTASPALWVQLHRSNHFLLEGITVNLAEIWHVEYEGIKIRDLGKAPQKNLKQALDSVFRLFHESVLPLEFTVIVTKKELDSDWKNEKEAARKKWSGVLGFIVDGGVDFVLWF
jgi:hypothetical protein